MVKAGKPSSNGTVVCANPSYFCCSARRKKYYYIGVHKMKISDFYLVELVLMLIQFYAANAINCFQCDYSKPGCDILTRADTRSPYYLPCKIANGTAFCRKTIQTVLSEDNFTIITRGCGWLTTKPNSSRCFKYDTQHKFDRSCQCYEDGCNSSFLPRPGYLVLTITITAAALHSWPKTLQEEKKMRRGCSFVFELLLVLICVFTAEGLDCFQCDAQDEGCDILTIANTKSPYYLPCPNGTSFCRKLSQTIVALEKTIITRKCGWISEYPKETKCIKYDTQFKHETTCQCYQNGCNSAYSVNPASPIPLLLTYAVAVTGQRNIASLMTSSLDMQVKRIGDFVFPAGHGINSDGLLDLRVEDYLLLLVGANKLCDKAI
ncbi:hypothetical protein Trydic_g3164 [Trypoxylus dichotomus]